MPCGEIGIPSASEAEISGSNPDRAVEGSVFMSVTEICGVVALVIALISLGWNIYRELKPTEIKGLERKLSDINYVLENGPKLARARRWFLSRK